MGLVDSRRAGIFMGICLAAVSVFNQVGHMTAISAIINKNLLWISVSSQNMGLFAFVGNKIGAFVRISLFTIWKTIFQDFQTCSLVPEQCFASGVWNSLADDCRPAATLSPPNLKQGNSTVRSNTDPCWLRVLLVELLEPTLIRLCGAPVRWLSDVMSY